MSAAPMPWEKYAAAPVDAGPWAKYSSRTTAKTATPSIDAGMPATVFPAPAGTPTIAKPSIEMNPVRTLTGTPYKPGKIERTVVNQIGGLGQQLANVSAPVIGHHILQRTGVIPSASQIYPDEGTLNDTMRDATVLVSGAEGEAPEPGTATPIPKPSVAPSASGVIDRVRGVVTDPDLIGIASPRAAHAIRIAQKIGRIADRLGGEAEPIAEAAKPAPAPIPETNGVPWGTGGQGPIDLRGKRIPPVISEAAPVAAPSETAAATPTAIPGAAGNLAESIAEPAPTLTNGARIKPAVAKDLGRMLNEATGAETPKPLRPGTPLRSQLAQQLGAAKLPEGFTPTPKSSFLQGFKYDPEAREFEYVTNDGGHYVRGDVGPEAFAAFERTAAEQGSFGKGWHALKNHPEGGVGQFQVRNGERVPVLKTMPATDLAQQIKDSAGPPNANAKIPKTMPATDLAKQIKQSAKASAKTAAKSNAIPKTAPAAESEDSLAAQLNEMNARVKKGESLKDLSKSR